MVPLKYLRNVWTTTEMRLINYKISFQLKWSKKFYSSSWHYNKSKSKISNRYC